MIFLFCVHNTGVHYPTQVRLGNWMAWNYNIVLVHIT